MSEKTSIQIDKILKDVLDSMGSKNESYNDILKRLIEKSKLSSANDLRTATVDKYGKASISRTLAGRTIEYRVKP